MEGEQGKERDFWRGSKRQIVSIPYALLGHQPLEEVKRPPVLREFKPPSVASRKSGRPLRLFFFAIEKTFDPFSDLQTRRHPSFLSPIDTFQDVELPPGQAKHPLPARAPAAGPARTSGQPDDGKPLLRPPRRCPRLPRLEPSASARIWTHVVLRTGPALEKFVNCARTSRAKLAAIVRVLKLRCREWERDWSKFAPVIPQLGLRALVALNWIDLKGRAAGAPVSTIAAFLSSCPGGARYHGPGSPCPNAKKCDGNEGEDVILVSTHGFDLDAIRWAIEKLKRMRIGGFIQWTEMALCNLLLRSVRCSLVKLSLLNLHWPHVTFPGIDAASLRNLEDLELVLHDPNPFFRTALIEAHPPLRYLVLCTLCGTLIEPLSLLNACPSISSLELISRSAITNVALALLEQHPPLEFLAIHYFGLSPRQALPEGTFPSEALQRSLRVCGSNLKTLDLCYSVLIDDALIACIA
ncbi:hypothetical protein BDK51DRAFT_51695 [Blyttiomyces helicus]|uniref:Uncharacterized protein n=1 Tax=Blyttiomyces helicus TaxID=388810 RepID=A0A4P9WA19_9FUNG|nr:hypothetical protein BDK51DRAFT_51695 [Blyttiomyces helicus]|eukprot:RKO87998.1 hypothetical protein BDK51DRAFT_51695 [Blyttiomyces helicus]